MEDSSMYFHKNTSGQLSSQLSLIININKNLTHLQVINLVVIILYRIGYGGDFLGTGGTWNLNEEKNADIEIIASGVFVGFFIYTAVQLIAICFKDRQDKERYVVSHEMILSLNIQ